MQDDLLIDVSFLDDAAPRRDQDRVGPTLEDVWLLNVATTRGHRDKGLAIYGAHPGDQVPMQVSCAHAEVCWISEHMDTFLSGQKESILWEPDIVADAKAKPAELSIKGRQLGWTSIDVVALKEGNATWNVDIEQVLLAMSGSNLAFFVETKARVKDASVIFDQFWDATTDDVCLGLSGHL